MTIPALATMVRKMNELDIIIFIDELYRNYIFNAFLCNGLYDEKIGERIKFQTRFKLCHFVVQVQCKDTRIAVQVRTNKAFNGRIYAMGRSETCNVDVIDSDVFRLDLSLSGQDCNTQSVVIPITPNKVENI